MAYRENTHLSQEVRDILLADAVLIIAFSLTLSGGIFNLLSRGTFTDFFTLYLPISAVAVTLSFILHEMMHKLVAQHYGAIAGFRTSYTGLLITILTGAAGFLLGIPGATMIYVNSFTRKENGIVSLAGPLTNFVVFGAALLLLVILNPPQYSFTDYALSFTLFISIYLAFFNMLPIYPLDGSKVLAWDIRVYVLTMAVILGLVWYFSIIPLSVVLYMVLIAIFFSMFYRMVL
jgi:Zn-dependent protease